MKLFPITRRDTSKHEQTIGYANYNEHENKTLNYNLDWIELRQYSWPYSHLSILQQVDCIPLVIGLYRVPLSCNDKKYTCLQIHVPVLYLGMKLRWQIIGVWFHITLHGSAYF